jgi:hypothetical protein
MSETATTTWLTPQDLVRLTGFSLSFIRNEIKAGELKAMLAKSPSRPRQRGRWRISVKDARRYCARLGFKGPFTVDVNVVDRSTAAAD